MTPRTRRCSRVSLRSPSPRARLAYWNMLVPRRRPTSLAPFIATREDVAAPLRARDRVPFYGDFVVEEVR